MTLRWILFTNQAALKWTTTAVSPWSCNRFFVCFFLFFPLFFSFLFVSSFSSCGVVKYAVDLFFLGYLCPRPPGTQVERNSPGHPLVVTSGVPCSLADEGYIYKLVSAVCRVSPNPPYASMSEFVRVRYRPLLITMSFSRCTSYFWTLCGIICKHEFRNKRVRKAW